MDKIELARCITEHGPSVGSHKGRDIPGYYLTGDGRRYEFVRTAWEDTDGTTPLDQLGDDESLIAPGLVYRHVNHS